MLNACSTELLKQLLGLLVHDITVTLRVLLDHGVESAATDINRVRLANECIHKIAGVLKSPDAKKQFDPEFIAELILEPMLSELVRRQGFFKKFFESRRIAAAEVFAVASEAWPEIVQ